MAANYTTMTQVTAPINVVAQRQLLEVAKPLCPYLVGTVPGSIMQGQGNNIIAWKRVENLTVNLTALTALSGAPSYPTRTPQQPTTTNLTATLLKYGQYILLNEEINLYQYSSHMQGLTEVLGIQAGRTVNQLQRNEEEDNSTAILSNSAASAAAVVTKLLAADVKRAVNQLQRNDAMKFNAAASGSQNFNTTPIRETFWGICHVDVEEDVREHSGFVDVSAYMGTTETVPGEFGYTRNGVRWISTSESSIDAEAGGNNVTPALRSSGNNKTDLYNTLIFGRRSYGAVSLDQPFFQEIYRAGDQVPGIQMIGHARGTSGVSDPLNEVSTMGWKTFHVGKVLNNNWSRCIRSGASIL